MKLKSLLFLSLLLLSCSTSVQTAEELTAKGNEYYYAGDYTKAVEYYQMAAEQGLAQAQNYFGYCYYNGKGVEQNYTEAVKWYRKAAGQGDVMAIEALKSLGKI